MKEPSEDGSSRAHSKREWAKDMMELIQSVQKSESDLPVQDTLPHIVLFGHDRGARLSYRMALDFPLEIAGLAVLDIVPTAYMWDNMKLENRLHAETRISHHWIFLSSPRPLPETLISANPEWYYKFKMRSAVGSKLKEIEGIPWVTDSFQPLVPNETEEPTGEKGRWYDRIVSICEDYRAGATIDIEDDIASGVAPESVAGGQKREEGQRPFDLPLLVLSSAHLRRRFPVDETWRSLSHSEKIDTYQVGDEGTGHFLVNEEQVVTGLRMREWLRQFELSQ